MSKKILHILKSNKYSGAENVACQIINMFKEDKEFEMAYASPDGPIKDTLKEKNIKYIPLKKFSYSELKKVIKEYKPDIIHAHDKSAILLASFFATPKTKVVAHIHCTFDILTNKNIKSFIFNLALKKCHNVISVSKQTYETYAYKDDIQSKSVVLRNIIDSKEIEKKALKDTNDYENDIIFLGRITHQKNPERLLEVIERVVKKIPNVRVAIVGDGELRKDVEAIIRENKLEKNIKMYGFMNNPYKILKQSKLLLMTSRNEGTPMVCLEAMSLGIPIISTPVDGLKEIVINNRNGFLSNSNEELSENIIKILKNTEYRENMYLSTKERFDEINDIEKYFLSLMDMYK